MLANLIPSLTKTQDRKLGTLLGKGLLLVDVQHAARSFINETSIFFYFFLINFCPET